MITSLDVMVIIDLNTNTEMYINQMIELDTKTITYITRTEDNTYKIHLINNHMLEITGNELRKIQGW